MQKIFLTTAAALVMGGVAGALPSDVVDLMAIGAPSCKQDSARNIICTIQVRSRVAEDRRQSFSVQDLFLTGDDGREAYADKVKIGNGGWTSMYDDVNLKSGLTYAVSYRFPWSARTSRVLVADLRTNNGTVTVARYRNVPVTQVR